MLKILSIKGLSFFWFYDSTQYHAKFNLQIWFRFIRLNNTEGWLPPHQCGLAIDQDLKPQVAAHSIDQTAHIVTSLRL